MDLTTFTTLDNTSRFDALATMTDAELDTLAMAAERAADVARFQTRDSATAAIMGLVATQARGESRGRFAPAKKVAAPFTGCVAKVNGRWVNW